MATPAPEARLLVVDDEQNIVELLEASLRFHGFEVVSCLDGKSALSLAKEIQPDLMVTDVMMPGLNGFDLVRSLRADGYQFPVLFLTAKDAVDDRVTGLTIGGDDYIVKPFSLSEVVARIRVVLKRTGKAKSTLASFPPRPTPISSSMRRPTRCDAATGTSPCRRRSSACWPIWWRTPRRWSARHRSSTTCGSTTSEAR